MRRRRAREFAKHAALWIVCAWAALPFLWMVVTSLRPESEILHGATSLLPQHPTLAGYAAAWQGAHFVRYFANSAAVALATTLFALVLATLAGYGFARYRIRGGHQLLLFILFTQMFPPILLAVPFYVLMRQAHLLDSLGGLMIVDTSFALPLAVWVMRNYFLGVPAELDEAARIDGCSRLGALWRVVVPVAAPGILAAGVFSFMLSWDEFMFANTFISSSQLRTLPLGLESLVGQYGTDWQTLMAGAVITTVPVVVAFLIVQRQLVSGLAAGAVKG